MNYITDPLSDAEFVRGLIDVIAVAVLTGVVGTFIVLRGVGFLGDALAHAIFPGVVVAFVIDANLLLGAVVAGLITAGLMGALTANQRVRDNTAIGVIFTAAFALGVVILANQQIDGEELEHILFGDPIGATTTDMILTFAIGGGVLAAMVILRRVFVTASFDPTGARAMGLPVLALDILLLLLTALTVVVAFKAVGNILVIALLITPAATARLLTDRLVPMTVLASALGVIASVAGLFIGYNEDTSAGGAIVLVSTAIFFAAWLFAPRTGVITTYLARRDLQLTHPEAEAEVILASPQIQTPHEA
jgi:manganese/iron transport system permease protein